MMLPFHLYDTTDGRFAMASLSLERAALDSLLCWLEFSSSGYLGVKSNWSVSYL
jgi:hypothetical protein